MSRRSKPTIPIPPGQVHGTRRSGGSREAATERVAIQGQEIETSGWTLNVSRGGARLIVEDRLELNQFYVLTMGEAPPREVRVVWVQDEADGQIVGVQFVDVDGSIPPPLDEPGQESPSDDRSV